MGLACCQASPVLRGCGDRGVLVQKKVILPAYSSIAIACKFLYNSQILCVVSGANAARYVHYICGPRGSYIAVQFDNCANSKTHFAELTSIRIDSPVTLFTVNCTELYVRTLRTATDWGAHAQWMSLRVTKSRPNYRGGGGGEFHAMIRCNS